MACELLLTQRPGSQRVVMGQLGAALGAALGAGGTGGEREAVDPTTRRLVAS